ncbi:hypothetical protein KKH27_04955, partial [bacterium]|nr:hypothetical protein [bacterium]
MTISCREKEEGTDELRPPLGVAFRISSGTPSGVISFFNLESGAVVAQEPMEHWAIVASEICPAARWVAVAEGRYNRMALFSLPSLLVLGSVAVGGAPVDVEASPTGHALFGITRNGTFWIGTLSSGELDTLEV